MNAARRKEIQTAVGLLEQAKSILETASSEERDYYDNMPEGLQGGEKGSAAEEAADALEEAVGQIDEAIENCGSAKGDT